MATQTVPRRNEIPREYRWDVESVFPSDAAWEEELRRIGASIPEVTAYQSRLAEGSAMLADGMEAAQRLIQHVLKAYVYASMFYAADTADQQAAAMNSTATGLFSQVQAAIAFLDPTLISIGFETLRRWMDEEPRLRIYAHRFEDLERQQAHVRSAEVEEVLGLAGDPFATASRTHSVLTDADLTFAPARDSAGAEYPIAQGTIDELLASPDRELRRTAWEHYADAHLAFKNTMANSLEAGVKQNVFHARVRRYPSSLEAATDASNIPVEVFHRLIETYRANLPTWHRYWEVRRRALGVETLYAYDVFAPLSRRSPRVPFRDAVEWISQGMAPLGQEYVETLRRGVLRQRWVDIYPNQGKTSGAFSSGAQGTHPFILTNYTDDIVSMSTLAHELGHSMHSYLTWQTQPFIYSDYSLFVAEVASNFNQAMVRAHLLQTNPDPEFQIAVIDEAMSNFHRYFFIMPALARFELEIHERTERGEGLTADGMTALMAGLFREGFGPNVAIDDTRVGSTWCQFSGHLYANFYVYQYATGISAANALAQGVLSGDQEAADRYLAFLKAGGSLYPLDALKLAGVDLTTPAPVEQAFGVLASLVDRLDTLVAQRE